MSAEPNVPTKPAVVSAAKLLISAKTPREFDLVERELFALLCDRNTARHLDQLKMMRHA